MKTTNQLDKNGREIFVGDTLKCDDGYKIVVIESEGVFCGQLVCDPNHPCANTRYALNPEVSEVVNVKNPLWRQPTPQMQYCSLLMGLDGWVSIAERNITKSEKYIPKIRECVEQLRALIPFIEGKEKW